jgi:hypothetical protein
MISRRKNRRHRRHRRLVAALTVVAVMACAGAASASAFTNFEAESAPVTLTGTQTETMTLTTTAFNLNCTEGSFVGSAATVKQETVETSLSYNGCRLLGIINFKITPNSCKFRFHAGGTADIVGCETGKPIEIEFFGCKVTFGNQTGFGPIGFANAGTGTGRTVTVSPAITNLTYSTTSACPGGAHTNETGGELTRGKFTLKGTSGKKAVGVFVG